MLNRFCFKKRAAAKMTAAFLISIFFSFFIFSVVPAFAVEETRPDDKEDDLKVYYSEALGAGEKVYHFTACKKVPSYAPLRCAKKDENTIIFPEQCKDKKGELLKGTIINGCIKKEQTKEYLDVDPAGLEKNKPDGCKDDPDRRAPYYASEYAVLKLDKEKKLIVQGTIAWDGGKPSPDSDIVKEVYSGKEKVEVSPAYRTGKCWPWDEIVDPEVSKLPEAEKQKIKEEKDKAAEQVSQDVVGIAERLRQEGCNNDNSAESPSFALEGDKAPPSIVHCTIYERLTGKTGVELFAKYVGAIYRWLGTIVGIVSVLIIVVSGIQISMAGGDTGGIDKAKNRIMQSLLGLAILFLSGLILYTINPGFFTG